MLAKDMVASFWMVVIFCAAVLTMISRSRAGKRIPAVNKVAGLDALDEAIGRATEMGRPVHYSPGIGDLQNAQTLASFSALTYVARQCARFDTNIIVTNRVPSVYPITEEIVRQAYAQEGKLDKYVVESVRFYSSEQFAYASACVGMMNRERPAANVLIGGFWAEALVIAEVGSQIGAIQISGTANTHQIPFFVAACDYCLIGEEIYAASAYLSKDPVLMGNLVAQDWAKMALTLVILVGALISTVSPKANWLATILNK
ncbi:MAG: hypothetical protein Q8P50_16920 [Bacillota bacterium]|nr:hypothetical protein [Bacillota bacterium]